jgi:hypothetical protein
MSPIPINLAVEDALSEAVLRKVLENSNREFAVGSAYGQRGIGYLRKMIRPFNNAAKGTPFLVLVDLDQYECAPVLIAEWLTDNQHHNLLFRVAVREVESWVLADTAGFATFLGISKRLVPSDTDGIPDPKQFLISLAKSSPRRDLKRDIVPPPASTRTIGPNYNGRLIRFISSSWDCSVARNQSPSLDRLVRSLEAFVPYWETQDNSAP